MRGIDHALFPGQGLGYKMGMKKLIVLVLLMSSAVGPVYASDGLNWPGWWLTPEQQAQRAFDRGAYDEAARLYQDPMRVGTAWYRAGEFERAAAAFGRVNTPEAAFNQGNALVLRGQYAAALDAYDRALQERPDWAEARENRGIAEIRLARKQASSEQGGKPTEIGADDVVFDQNQGNGQDQDEIEVESAQGMSDQELRALWLRKSQTSPAVFLKAKFAAQLAAENQGEAGQ